MGSVNAKQNLLWVPMFATVVQRNMVCVVIAMAKELTSLVTTVQSVVTITIVGIIRTVATSLSKQ